MFLLLDTVLGTFESNPASHLHITAAGGCLAFLMPTRMGVPLCNKPWLICGGF